MVGRSPHPEGVASVDGRVFALNAAAVQQGGRDGHIRDRPLGERVPRVRDPFCLLVSGVSLVGVGRMASSWVEEQRVGAERRHVGGVLVHRIDDFAGRSGDVREFALSVLAWK